MKYLSCLIICLCIAFFRIAPAQAEEVQKADIPGSDTYLLVISICPPWKPDLVTFCKPAVTQVSEVFQQRLGIPQENIHIVLNEQGTYQGLQEGFAWLKNKTNPHSRAIIYFNTHGGREEEEDGFWGRFDRNGHEMFVLWTKERPGSVEEALDSKQWILASDVRAMLDPINAEKIMIIDACHAGLGKTDLIAYKKDMPAINKREAFIFSSPPLSAAQAAKTVPLFTSYLVKAVAKADNLKDAYSTTRRQTLEAALHKAIHEDECLVFLRGGKEICVQLPIKEDPNNLLEQVKFLKK